MERGGVMIGDGYSTYAESTLMKHSKKELISIIRMLEKNLRNANECNDRQYEILKAVDTKAIDEALKKCGYEVE